MIPILANLRIRYWQGRAILARTPVRYWLEIRYWLPILAGLVLAFSILACSFPVWSSTQALGPTPTALPSQAPQKPQELRIRPTRTPAPVRETVSANKALNVRQGASEKSPGLGTLLHGAPVSLTGKCTPGWAEIRYKMGRAWVRARYITGDLCEEE